MATYPFLSDEWIAEARRIRAEYGGSLPTPPLPVRMNLVVRGTPSSAGVLEAHLDTTGGELDLETGHLERPDLTVTMDHATARQILVDGDPQAAMQAFLGGRIRVDGDITKLLTLQSSGVVGGLDPDSLEMAGRIAAITE